MTAANTMIHAHIVAVVFWGTGGLTDGPVFVSISTNTVLLLGIFCIWLDFVIRPAIGVGIVDTSREGLPEDSLGTVVSVFLGKDTEAIRAAKGVHIMGWTATSW